MRKTLLLFTGSYPYSATAETTFLEPEVEVLRRYFDGIVLIPARTGGAREKIHAPNVTVDTSFAAYTSSLVRRAAYALFAPLDPRFVRELVAHVPTSFDPRALLRLAMAHVASRLTERWMRRLTRTQKLDDCVLYSWWFDGTTLGLATIGNGKGTPVITRAHGSDLYESRQSPPYIPFRRVTLERITMLYSASAAGAKYLAERYPRFREKIQVSLLGVEDPGFLNPASTDDVFRIVSCSFLLPVKRIDRMIHGLAETGRAHPARRFKWTHIGVGPLRNSLQTLARTTLPRNVEYEFRDYPGKQGLSDFYRTEPADLFLNTSSSEGTPVAMMEAISVGIPVLATAVGGNTEIVGPDNGITISANGQAGEIANAISELMRDRARLTRLRAGSRSKWQEQYSAERNYSTFAEQIRALSVLSG